MPTKNRIKVYVPDTFYHVYNRGWNRTRIFQADDDYSYFESLLARHLSVDPVVDAKGREYRWLRSEVQLNAYCLMPNHFHILIYQFDDIQAISKLMSSVLTAYTMYFNRKYKRRGSLFESTYKAVPIIDDTQLMHITRYIHLNHSKFRTWPYSSYHDYMGVPQEWIVTKPILELFNSKQEYQEFVDDYEEMQRLRDTIKVELANG
jgi:putative transposase